MLTQIFANKGADQNQGVGDLDREEMMQKSDVNQDGEPNTKQTAAAPDVIRRGPIKFAYASGSQPLKGFTIKRGVGFGGFGDVYYATSDAGKEVALKRIQRNLDVELRGVRQ